MLPYSGKPYWVGCFSEAFNNAVLFSSHTEVGREHAVVYRRQSRLFPISESGRAAVHYAPCRHHTVCVWQQPAAVFQRGELLSEPLSLLNFYAFTMTLSYWIDTKLLWHEKLGWFKYLYSYSNNPIPAFVFTRKQRKIITIFSWLMLFWLMHG